MLLIAPLEGMLTLGAHVPNGVVKTIEGAGLMFCSVGVAAGSRDLRSAFISMGSDKGVARQDREYMRSRAQVQVAAVAFTAAVGLVAARRFNVLPLIPLAGAAIFGLILPIVNRAMGWCRSA